MCAATMGDQQPPLLPEDVDLRGVCEALLADGWEALLERRPLLGDEDVRVRIGGDEGPSVELLGRWGEEYCGDRWQAVRAGPDGRAVWCGPPRGCSKGELVRFVEDLLQLDSRELGHRYLCRG